MDNIKVVREIFHQRYGTSPLMVIAPGRINLIGEHTDYNNGFVMPSAIDHYFVFALAPNKTKTFSAYSTDLNEASTFTIEDINPGHHWTNYFMGVLQGLQQKGCALQGFDCVFGGNIPVGAGLSSSAALCSGFGFALNEVFNYSLSRLEIAKIAQYAEHNFAGVKCGIMDMYACLFSEKNSVILLDCRSLTHEYLPFEYDDVEILLMDTKVKHTLASSAYNKRREACEEGVSIIHKDFPDVTSLRDVSIASLETYKNRMTKEVFEKSLFVTEEIQRTQDAATLLRNKDLVSFGKLMNRTHWGLSHLYEVSCDESDFLVKCAEEEKDSILGSRMMGGGFGGCTINLVRKGSASRYTSAIREKYFAAFKKEPDFYLVNLSQGVHTFESS
ncbi:MAG TPA: galactokinase [Chryseolinea sp.]|nr:galactokinase [Chryseolinea sp.]